MFRFAKVLETYQAMGEVEWARSPEAALAHWRDNGFTAFGMGVIGTPDDAIARIEDFVAQSGGFGTFLVLAHNTAIMGGHAAELRPLRSLRRAPLPRHQREQAREPRVVRRARR